MAVLLTAGPWHAGVILLSEDLHRVAYNAAFEHFDVRCDGELVVWSEEFYDMLQNTVGGGKPKMRWYFSANCALCCAALNSNPRWTRPE